MNLHANDNDILTVEGGGNIFRDLELDDADKAMAALREFYAKGGRRFEDFKAELDAVIVDLVPRIY